MRQQVQLEVGLGRRSQRAVLGQQGGDQRVLAFGQALQQAGLSGSMCFSAAARSQAWFLVMAIAWLPPW